MTDQRTRYLPQDDAISALLREAEVEAIEADPIHREDGISQLLEEAGLHRDPPPPPPKALGGYAWRPSAKRSA